MVGQTRVEINLIIPRRNRQPSFTCLNLDQVLQPHQRVSRPRGTPYRDLRARNTLSRFDSITHFSEEDEGDSQYIRDDSRYYPQAHLEKQLYHAFYKIQRSGNQSLKTRKSFLPSFILYRGDSLKAGSVSGLTSGICKYNNFVYPNTIKCCRQDYRDIGTQRALTDEKENERADHAGRRRARCLSFRRNDVCTHERLH